MKKKILTVLGAAGVLAAGLTTALLVFAGPAAGTVATQGTTTVQGGKLKVTICHRTDSHSNPYVQETVAIESVDGNANNDNGKGDHLLDHTGPVFPATGQDGKWGDIIPPVSSDMGSTVGLNWTDAGQAIYNNGCNVPETPPTTETTTVTVPTTVTTPGTTVTTPGTTVTTPGTTVTTPGTTVTTPGGTTTVTTTTTTTTPASKPPKKHHKPSSAPAPKKKLAFTP
jgi:hypothetical protein